MSDHLSVPQQYGQPPLDWPHYGIGPVDAIARYFRKYATFTGRASRGEYWWLVAFNALVYVAVVVGGGLVGGLLTETTAGPSSTGDDGQNPVLSAYLAVYLLYCLATVVPSIALAVRRLHDTGRSGWTYLLALIPVAGSIILLVFLIGDTSPAAERYGPPSESRPPSPGGYGLG